MKQNVMVVREKSNKKKKMLPDDECTNTFPPC